MPLSCLRTLAITGLFVAASISLAVAPRPTQERPAPESPLASVSVQLLNLELFGDQHRQGIFFAVLEGLYRDGVSNELVDEMLERDPTTGWPANFVWACPICMPVIDALDVYRARPMFRGRKFASDTFGDGLPAELSSRILGSDPAAKLAAIRETVERWIGAWVDARRFTPDERARWQAAMEEGRKQGMACLEAYRQLGGNWAWMKECPACEAGNEACRTR